jgi:hypothetical protein
VAGTQLTSELIALVACWAVAATGLATGFDPAAADLLWTQATPADLRDPAHFDAVRICARARPWDEAWARCRARLDAVDAARAGR